MKNASEDIRLSMTRKAYELYLEPAIDADSIELRALLIALARREWGDGAEVRFGPGKQVVVAKGRMREVL